MGRPADSESERSASLGRIALTDRTVRALKPPSAGRIDVWDEDYPGFGLRISASGRRTWILMYRIGKTLRRFTLGQYPTLGLAEARGRARDALHDVDHGQDPARDKIAERQAETFGDLSREYIERHASKKRSGREDIRLLNGSPHKKRTGKKPHIPLVTRWGNRKLKDIKRRDVRDLLEEIAARAPIMANRTLALVRKMFNFAIEHDWLEANPCHMVKQPGQEKQRDRVLSEDEIRALWKALDSEDAIIAAVFRLRLLTAQRGGEVLGATWDEMDLTAGWWTIPAARSKNGLAHRVPLSPQALKVLKSLRSVTGDSSWVFPSPKKEDASIAHAQKAIERLVERSGVDFRGHDLRRTAASLMVGAGVPRLVVSKILNHVETGVTAVYDRHSYDLEKRAALDFWGRRLEAIVANKRPAAKLLRFSAAS
jgi:integrase